MTFKSATSEADADAAILAEAEAWQGIMALDGDKIDGKDLLIVNESDILAVIG